MKIATWNLERPKTKNPAVIEKLAEINAEIIVLTETNSIINPGTEYSSIESEILQNDYDRIAYQNGENRTTIWSKYKIIEQYKTYDNYTSVCAAIETSIGNLIVYGTIVGVFGGIGKRFLTDLDSQILDFEKLSKNKNSCICGDFNVMFSGYAYPSLSAREKLNQIFEKLKLVNLTSEIKDNVDHIVVSKDFIKNQSIAIQTWNEDKKLSDHIGVCVNIY